MAENPVKPNFTVDQLESLILDAEITGDNARVALKTYAKERIEIRTKLKNLEVNEATKKQEIEKSEALIKKYQEHLREVQTQEG